MSIACMDHWKKRWFTIVWITWWKFVLKLQMDPKLTLKTAVATAGQNEVVQKQQSIVRLAEQPKHWPCCFQEAASTSRQISSANSPTKSKKSDRCGKLTLHSYQKCLAWETIYHRCSKKGHYSAVCRTAESVCKLIIDSFSFTQWHLFWLQIDIGAYVTVIPESIFMLPCMHSVSGPCQIPSQFVGNFKELSNMDLTKFNKTFLSYDTFTNLYLAYLHC